MSSKMWLSMFNDSFHMSLIIQRKLLGWTRLNFIIKSELSEYDENTTSLSS